MGNLQVELATSNKREDKTMAIKKTTKEQHKEKRIRKEKALSLDITTETKTAGKDYSRNDPRVGKKFFTRHGRVTVVAVSFDSAKVETTEGVEKEVKLTSLREKAVASGARNRYPSDHDTKTASGKPSIGRPDEITDALKGLVSAELGGVFEENGLDSKKYKHLNPGMKRMTLGNLLRGMASNGKSVKINGKKVVG